MPSIPFYNSLSMTKVIDTDTYLFNIDRYGNISAHLEDYIRGFEAYSGAIRQEVDEEGMQSFFLHLSDKELLVRHPGVAEKSPITKPIRPAATDPNFSNILKLYNKDEMIYSSYRLIDAFYKYLTDDLKEKIKRVDPLHGMSSVTCNSIYKHLISQYGKLTDSARNDLRAIIS